MNKRYLITLFALFALLFSQCSRYRVSYNIPAQYPEAMRTEIKKTCDRGKILFKQHCSECHGVFTKGKDNIPNFSIVELHRYSEKYIMRDRTNHAVAIHMSPQQLGEVLTFLKYKSTKNKNA